METMTMPFVGNGVDFEDDAQVMRAIQMAVRDALQRHKDCGQYVIVERNGLPVRIEAEDIIVPPLPDEIDETE